MSGDLRYRNAQDFCKDNARTSLRDTGVLRLSNLNSSTGKSTTNKIKTMKRQAYGFRDLEFFKLKVMAIHETRYALVE